MKYKVIEYAIDNQRFFNSLALVVIMIEKIILITTLINMKIPNKFARFVNLTEIAEIKPTLIETDTIKFIL